MNINSLVSSLKNKVAYNLHQAVDDPEANSFASNQPVSESTATTEEVQEDSDYFDISSTDDPNTFNSTRLLKKIGNQTIRIIKKGFFPCIAIILSMYVANELIVYSAPIRLIFFMVTFLICYSFMPFLILLLGYYLCKAGYSYYLNHLSEGPKTKIMPTIFALLPLTTSIPASSLGAFFMYPFTYPKNNKDAKQLPIIMNEYMESLKSAFIYYDKVKNLPFVAEGFERLEANIEHLHDVPEPKNPEPKEPVSSAPIAPLPATINLPKTQMNSPLPQTSPSPPLSETNTLLPPVINTTLPPPPPSYNNTSSNTTLSPNTTSTPLPPAYNNTSSNTTLSPNTTLTPSPLPPPSYNNTTSNTSQPSTQPSAEPSVINTTSKEKRTS